MSFSSTPTTYTILGDFFELYIIMQFLLPFVIIIGIIIIINYISKINKTNEELKQIKSVINEIKMEQNYQNKIINEQNNK